ncbi:MAG: WG repeat-containing protein [Pyrinomonadaceae bacterium]
MLKATNYSICAFMVIFTLFCTNVSIFAFQKLYPVKERNLWGYIDEKGNKVIPIQFRQAGEFSEDRAMVQNQNGLFGYINSKGHFVIAPIFENASDFSGGLARVAKENKSGYIDRNGNLVIDFQFDEAGYFSEGLAYVLIEGFYGYIDRTGKFKIAPKFVKATGFVEGTAPVMVPVNNELKIGYINKTGDFVIPPMFVTASSFFEGVASVSTGEILTLTDRIAPLVRGPFSNYLIDRSGKRISNDFEAISRKFDKLTPAMKDGKWGYIDKNGVFSIAPIFEEASAFSKDGIAVVKKEENYGLIHMSGEFFVMPRYDFVKWMNGIGLLRKGPVQYIDRNNRVILRSNEN